MSIFFLVLLLAFNGLIATWNAAVTGMTYNERNAHGTFMSWVFWSGYVQSIIGYSMIVIFGEVAIASAFGFVSHRFIEAALNLWYIAAIVPCIGTGLILTIHSWQVAYRERSFGSMGVAAYNTYAQADNMYHAATGLSSAFSKVGEFLSSSDDDENALSSFLVKLALVLFVGVGILGGYFITEGVVGYFKKRQLAAPAVA